MNHIFGLDFPIKKGRLIEDIGYPFPLAGFDILNSAKAIFVWGETSISPFLIGAFVLLNELIILRFLNFENLNGRVFELSAVDIIERVDIGDYFFIIFVSLFDSVAMPCLDALAALE